MKMYSKFLLSSLLVLLTFNSYTKASELPRTEGVLNTLLPFTSDSCTAWVDGFAGKDYTNCCLQHDVKYWMGGTQKEKLQADQDLFKCINKVQGPLLGPIMSSLTYLGVRVAGKLHPTNVYRWGFGWKYYRDTNKPLSSLEKKMALNLLPENLNDAVVKYMSQEELENTVIPTYQAEPFPSITKDYCLDEVAAELSRRIPGKNGIQMSYHPYSSLSNSPAFNSTNTYVIKTNLCEGTITARFQVTSLEMCKQPYYSTYATTFLQILRGTDGCEFLNNRQ